MNVAVGSGLGWVGLQAAKESDTTIITLKREDQLR